MNKTKRKNKGITLIALVITIIVLLILAGVTIASLSGDNGILTRATQAKEETKKRQVEEAIKLAITEIDIDSYTKNRDKEDMFWDFIYSDFFDEVVDYYDDTMGLILNGYEARIDCYDFNIIGEITKAENTINLDKNAIKITLLDGTPAKDKTIDRGTSMKIENIKIDVTGGEIMDIYPELEGTNPYSYTTFGTENEILIQIDAEIKGEGHSKLLKISLANKYKEGINHCEVIVPTINKQGNLNNPNIYEVREGNIPIPVGYTYVKGDVKGGAVIKETDGEAEFVWVPVGDEYKNNNMFGTETNNIDRYGKLYAKQNLDTPIGRISNGYREPDILTYNNYDKNHNITKEQLQEEFNKMAASVEKYGGFYVGRYESSLNNNILKPIKGKESATAAENSANTWYGLYNKQKAYEKGNIKGSMIWGCQWDAMCKWIKSNKIDVEMSKSFAPSDITGNIGKWNATRITGNEDNDKLCNIYDLLGNSFELTLEANDTCDRVCRGGNYGDSSSPAIRDYYSPTDTYCSLSTRATLYIP